MANNTNVCALFVYVKCRFHMWRTLAAMETSSPLVVGLKSNVSNSFLVTVMFKTFFCTFLPLFVVADDTMDRRTFAILSQSYLLRIINLFRYADLYIGALYEIGEM